MHLRVNDILRNSMPNMTDPSCVKVAVRIRPQISRDIIDLCHVCTSVAQNEPQIWLGKDKAFTFDEVFNMPTTQDEIFFKCIQVLLDGCFDGYNATVLAYGQTGSGKTYTMGTGFDLNLNHGDRGIIPRAVEYLFNEMAIRQNMAKQANQPVPEFKVNAQFMELYNEEIIDLLDTSRDHDNRNKKQGVKIHEGSGGEIYTQGIIAQSVTSVEEALQCLKLGSLCRTTASTGMNVQSSRSHAIFTLHLKQRRIIRCILEDDTNEENSDVLDEFETLTAKFHFVDLAGSERLKRTKAEGERKRESISINSGLLALGNVISALGTTNVKRTHVPYRDSKLTRLLQDSLGGNSRTLMIACISPSDRDFMETLNTLKYANRAKNIKNKVVVNMDKASLTITTLRHEIENLKLELLEYKQGKRMIGEDGIECINDMYYENTMLQGENNSLKTQVKALQETVERLTIKNSDLLTEKASCHWITPEGALSDVTPVIREYIKEIETLRARLLESEEVSSLLRKHQGKHGLLVSSGSSSMVAITGKYDIRSNPESPTSVYELIEEAKDDVKQMKKRKKKLKASSFEKENTVTIVEMDDDNSVNEKDIENNDVIESDTDETSENTSDSEKEQLPEENYRECLVVMTRDISLKEKLINELESSQRRILNMRQKYEEKIIHLQNIISETEKDRDQFLLNCRGSGFQHSEKTRKQEEDYDKKLNDLRNEMKAMQACKKEHQQAVKTQGLQEKQLKQARLQLDELKKAKTALMRKIRDESKKFKEADNQRKKEIAQLRRDHRSKDTQIRTLQAENRVKDANIRRKQEEMNVLRQRNKNVQTNKASRTGSHGRISFSQKVAKQNWQLLETKINKLVHYKQYVSTIEKDMNRWLTERDKLWRCLEKVTRKRDRAVMENKTPDVIRDLEEDVETLTANLEYVHQNIRDCQSSIVAFEDSKDDMDAIDLPSLLCQIHPEESKYLIEKLLNMSVNQSLQALLREGAMKEMESQLNQVLESNAVQEQLLYHVVHQSNMTLRGSMEFGVFPETTHNDGSADSSRSGSPSNDKEKGTFVIDRQRKAREISGDVNDFLFSPTKVKNEVQLRSDFENSDPDDGQQVRPSTALIERNNEESNLLWGGIVPINQRSSIQQTSVYLNCTHIIEGHDGAVTGLDCTDEVLFSCSKDGTARVWDLTTSDVVQVLGPHPSSVTSVKYTAYSRLAFTISMCYVKVWDIRQKATNCIYTLCSSGVCQEGNMLVNPSSKIIPPGENEINAISLNPYGTMLFSAAAGTIRMWDLKMFQSIGVLNPAFQSHVTCLAVDDMDIDTNIVACGCDESIKTFEVSENSRGIVHASYSFSQAHNSRVEQVVINGDNLFSSSKDIIKKWTMRGTDSPEKVFSPRRRAKIRALNIIPSGNLLLSGSDNGYLTLWNTSTCQSLEELNGHGEAINSITSNNSCMFTACQDHSIGVWVLNSSNINRLD